MKKEIISVAYPVTIFPNQQTYEVGTNCKKIEFVKHNGEMATIDFIKIELKNGTFIEVIMSMCVVNYREINATNN